ncbi:unnamed protein product [Caretta caretta]
MILSLGAPTLLEPSSATLTQIETEWTTCRVSSESGGNKDLAREQLSVQYTQRDFRITTVFSNSFHLASSARFLNPSDHPVLHKLSWMPTTDSLPNTRLCCLMQLSLSLDLWHNVVLEEFLEIDFTFFHTQTDVHILQFPERQALALFLYSVTSVELELDHDCPNKEGCFSTHNSQCCAQNGPRVAVAIVKELEKSINGDMYSREHLLILWSPH